MAPIPPTPFVGLSFGATTPVQSNRASFYAEVMQYFQPLSDDRDEWGTKIKVVCKICLSNMQKQPSKANNKKKGGGTSTTTTTGHHVPETAIVCGAAGVHTNFMRHIYWHHHDTHQYLLCRKAEIDAMRALNECSSKRKTSGKAVRSKQQQVTQANPNPHILLRCPYRSDVPLVPDDVCYVGLPDAVSTTSGDGGGAAALDLLRKVLVDEAKMLDARGSTFELALTGLSVVSRLCAMGFVVVAMTDTDRAYSWTMAPTNDCVVGGTSGGGQRAGAAAALRNESFVSDV